MKRNRLLNIGFPLLLYCLQCVSLIKQVHSLEKRNVVSTRNEPHPVYYQGVHGKPGVDFPVLTSIPKTYFSCKDIETGYYADLETNCQVFHICEDGKKTSFLCPNGTIFQQSDLICDWWFKVNCTSSPLLYEESSEQLKEESIKRKSARRITWKSSDKTSTDSGNLKGEIVSPQNKIPVNNNLYEEKEIKNHPKPNWSSVYNKPQWRSNGETKAKFIEDFDIRTSQEYQSTTEKFESSTQKTNENRKIAYPSRKKPTEEPKKIVYTTKSTVNKYQIKNKTNFKKSNSKTEYITTEENVMTVTPETTVGTSSTHRRRFHYKDAQKPFSSTISSSIGETTTTSRFYIPKRRKESISTTTMSPKYENQELQKPSVIISNPEFDQNKYVNIFVGTRQKVIRTNNGRLADNRNDRFKTQQKNRKVKIENEKTSSTKYLNNESNVLSEDSDETQVPQETASIVENNRYNLNRGKPVLYENHKSEYSEIKSLESYNEKYFNNIVPVTSQYVTTQSFNNGKTFVGSSVGTPIPRNKTDINDHNKKTFKLSAIAFNTAQALNPFQKGYSESNYLIYNTGISSDYNKPTDQPYTVALNTIKPFNPIIESDTSNTEAANERNKHAFEVSTEALNPLSNANSNSSTFMFESKEEDKEDVLKHSTISLNTAQAYESLFNDETKSLSNKENEITTSPTPEVISDTSPFGYQTDTPFTSNRLEIPTTTEEPANDDIVDIKFGNEYKIQHEFTTESILTTPIPTKPPQAPQKPRPFELLATESTSFDFRNDKSENSDDVLQYPFFQISTASPFSLKEVVTRNENDLRVSDFPTTEPTQFYIKPDEVSVNDDIQTQESSETFRPGLVVPSSVSPQTLHTLATYFENALSNMTSEEREILSSNDDLDNVNMEEKLRVLLSNMTKQKYEQLFKQMDSDSEENVENTTLKNVNDEDDSEDPQKVRKLAKLFSQALSEYLHDPTNFKNRLQQVRPTEPPSHGNVFNTEKELLSFSEDDSKNTLASLYNSTWNIKPLNKSNIESDENNNFLTSEGEGLTIADSQSFVSQFNNLSYEDKQKVGKENLPKNHWTSSAHATNLWRTTFAVDPFSLNKHFQVTESYSAITPEAETTESYSDIESPGSPEEEEINYELRVFPKLSSNSSKLQGILIDFMNSSNPSEGERLHRILRKLNTTEDEFLDRMKKIEENPLTRRLILLLIHECETTKHEKEELIPFLNPEKQSEEYFSSSSGSVGDDDKPIDKDQDARALQLLNSLYNIATKFGR